MHDDNGKVRIPGFYDGITQAVGQAAQAVGRASASMAQSSSATSACSVPAGEKRYSVLEQIWARPTVEFNGITGGYQGVGTKTVIPSKASVKITCRLVPGQDPDKVLKAVEAFVQASGCRRTAGSSSRPRAARPAIAFDPTVAASSRAPRRRCRRNGASRRR